MTNSKHADNIEISAALPAFNPRERGKFVWNIIIKFLPPKDVIANIAQQYEAIPLYYSQGGFLQRRNFLLQYVPVNWEIDVDPENLL